MARIWGEFKSAVRKEIGPSTSAAVVLTGIFGAIVGGGAVAVNSFFVAPEDGTQGNDASALQVSRYNAEIAKLSARANAFNLIDGQLKALKNAELYPDQDNPAHIARIKEVEEKRKAYLTSYQTDYDNLGYKVASDKTLGEDDTAQLIRNIQFSTGAPEWMNGIKTNGLQECRAAYEKELAENYGPLMSSCTAREVREQRVGSFIGGLIGTYGFFFGLSPLAAAFSAVRKQKKQEEEECTSKLVVRIKGAKSPEQNS